MIYRKTSFGGNLQQYFAEIIIFMLFRNIAYFLQQNVFIILIASHINLFLLIILFVLSQKSPIPKSAQCCISSLHSQKVKSKGISPTHLHQQPPFQQRLHLNQMKKIAHLRHQYSPARAEFP